MTHSMLGRGRAVSAGALALAAVCAAAPASAAAQDILLAPHRAVYEMTLVTTRGGTGVTAVSGRMVYELTGSVCEGYTQNMRFVTQMTNQGGTTMVTDLRSSSWEEGSGRRFRFNSSQFRDEKPTEATAGDAARANTADDIKVELTKPAKKGLSLSARVYFPIQHSIALLQAAKSGKASFRADLYDGSEKGEKVYDTVSIIGRHRPAGANRQLPRVKNVEGARRAGGLAGVDRLLRAGLRQHRCGAGLRAVLPVLRERCQPQPVHRLRRVRHARRPQGDQSSTAEQVRAEVAAGPSAQSPPTQMDRSALTGRKVCSSAPQPRGAAHATGVAPHAAA